MKNVNELLEWMGTAEAVKPMAMKRIKELKAGEFFKTKPEAKKIYVMGELVHWQWKRSYDKQTKKYYCENYGDVNNGIYVDGDKYVFIDFEY